MLQGGRTESGGGGGGGGGGWGRSETKTMFLRILAEQSLTFTGIS